MLRRKFHREFHLLAARHDEIARRYTEVPVPADAAFHHVNAAGRQTLRQLGHFMLCRQAHRTLQVTAVTRTGGGSGVFRENHDGLTNAVGCGG